MSATTKAALEAAMFAHINDEEESPHHITAWVLAAAISAFDGDDRGQHTYWFDRAENQAPHITVGMIAMFDDWAGGNDEDD